MMNVINVWGDINFSKTELIINSKKKALAKAPFEYDISHITQFEINRLDRIAKTSKCRLEQFFCLFNLYGSG